MRLKTAAAIAVSLVMAGPVPARAGKGHAAVASHTSTMNFVDADIEAVARAMAAMLGKPIFVDPRVKGRLNLYTEESVTDAQAYTLFLSALRGLGAAAVEVGGLIKVVVRQVLPVPDMPVLPPPVKAAAPAEAAP